MKRHWASVTCKSRKWKILLGHLYTSHRHHTLCWETCCWLWLTGAKHYINSKRTEIKPHVSCADNILQTSVTTVWNHHYTATQTVMSHVMITSRRWSGGFTLKRQADQTYHLSSQVHMWLERKNKNSNAKPKEIVSRWNFTKRSRDVESISIINSETPSGPRQKSIQK